MKESLRHFKRILIVMLIVAGSFNSTVSPAAATLTDADLGAWGAVDFWKDPCTWHGFISGLGTVFCFAGSPAACATALYSVWRAYKADNCF